MNVYLSFRTYCILYGVELLLFADISGAAGRTEEECSGFLGLPVPCGRGLWEPVEDSMWRKRYREDILNYNLGITRHLTIKQLIQARKGKNSESSQSLICGTGDAIGSWCSNVDEFGALLWMAVGLT